MGVATDPQEVARRVEAIAAPIVRSLQLELVGVECSGQGPRTLLRVFIDKPGGVTLGDCEQVHVSLGHALDVEDPIPHAYTLEVSSPGLDRPLRRLDDFRRVLGQSVTVKLKQPIAGQWRIAGEVRDATGSGLVLVCGKPAATRTVEVEWENVAEGRLEVHF